MGFLVSGGALIQCTFGAAPGTLNVLPANKVMVMQAAANIMDNKPILNITPFGMCSSPANPMVAAATAAALGVLTPMPCVPAVAAPWVPGQPTVLVGTFPALNDASKCICNWGGVIQINFAGQTKVML